MVAPPQQRLYFFPEPHGHRSFRPILLCVRRGLRRRVVPSLLPALPKIAIRFPQTNHHRLDYLFTLLRSNRFRTQGWIFVVFVVKRQHRNHASALFVIGHQFGPTTVAQAGPPG